MTSQVGIQIVKTVGRNIARARKERALSQHELALLVGMDGRGISRYENGRVLPSPERLAALADHLRRDIAWFYTEHDDEPAVAA